MISSGVMRRLDLDGLAADTSCPCLAQCRQRRLTRTRLLRCATAPADRPLRADHAAGRAARRARRTAGRSSSCSRGGCPRAAGTAWWPASAGCSTRSSRSGSTTRRSRALDGRRRRRPTLTWLADYRFSGDIWGYAEGEIYFPDSPLLIVESTLRRGGAAGDAAAVDLQPRLGDRVGRLADDAGGRRPAVHRDGLAAHPRGGRGGGRAGGVRRRLREHLEPRRPAAVRRPDRRHQRAQLHAAARHRGGRVPRPGRRRWASAPRCWSTPTTSPRRCGSASRSPARSSARCGIDSGDLGVLAAQVRAQLDDLGAHRHPDRRDQRPRRVRDRRAGRRRRSTATASAPSWSPAAATRPAASSTSSSPARTTTGDAACRWRRRASTRSRSAAASTRCAGATPTASPRPR